MVIKIKGDKLFARRFLLGILLLIVLVVVGLLAVGRTVGTEALPECTGDNCSLEEVLQGKK